MPLSLFWFFASLMLVGGIAVLAFKNPVSSALSMVASFVGLAGLFIGLNAFFVGIIQILVYAGAIMVLFIFIIMLLDLKVEDKRKPRLGAVAAGFAVFIVLTVQLVGVISKTPDIQSEPLDFKAASAAYATTSPNISQKLATEHLPDVNLIGDVLFKGYNLPLQIVGVLLLVSTVGVVVLSKRQPS